MEKIYDIHKVTFFSSCGSNVFILKFSFWAEPRNCHSRRRQAMQKSQSYRVPARGSHARSEILSFDENYADILFIQAYIEAPPAVLWLT